MKDFKFFHGRVSNSNASTDDIEDYLINQLSEEMRREIDTELVRILTRRVNGGGNDNLQYLNHYINMGGGNRA